MTLPVIGQNKTCCVWLTDGEERIQEHAQVSSFPADCKESVWTALEPSFARA